tara:strand:+ start:41 stop:1378 length:1338 start_codon:yes stop_codon:yes gene_type:complete
MAVDIQKQTEDLAKKLGTDATKVDAITKQVEPEELLTQEGKTLTGEGTTVQPALLDASGDKTTIQQVEKPTGIGLAPTAVTSSIDKINAQEFKGATTDFDISNLIDIEDVSTQQLSDGATITPAQAELDEKATVQYQLSELLSGIEDGKPLPEWASPAARKATAIMQQRGLGSSSMAAAAITQAIMESGVSIAARDANAYAAIQLKNLDNRQQAAVQNALQIATMDRQNASARVQSSISNAQALLSVDLKELDAQQQANTIKYNALSQGALTEAAQQTAREQFNAKSEFQVEEFYAELGLQIDGANINRQVAIDQFNVNQQNAFGEFNAKMNDQRQKFNANMRNIIDQSNTKWRREINTVNTATQNETNRINTQLMYNISGTALNDLWQQYRDNATFNFTASESDLQRKHEQVIQALDAAANADAYDKSAKTTLASNIIKVIGKW